MDKYKRNKNFSIFRKPPYRLLCVKKNLGILVDNIKCGYQRAKYGISRRDCWDFNDYLFVICENAFKVLDKDHMGTPLHSTHEEWDNWLRYMRRLSELANMEDDLTTELFIKYTELEKMFGKDDELVKAARKYWLDMENTYYETCVEAQDKLLQGIMEHKDDLWD